jgi:hypothetical protein
VLVREHGEDLHTLAQRREVVIVLIAGDAGEDRPELTPVDVHPMMILLQPEHGLHDLRIVAVLQPRKDVPFLVLVVLARGRREELTSSRAVARAVGSGGLSSRLATRVASLSSMTSVCR